MDCNILPAMRKIEGDLGKEWVTRIEVEQHQEFNPKWKGDWRVDDSLKRLTNLAKIMKSPKGLGIEDTDLINIS